MNKIPQRFVVYTIDVMNITGKSINTCQKMLQQTRKKFKKPERSLVTVEEFCNYTGFKIEAVMQYLSF